MTRKTSPRALPCDRIDALAHDIDDTRGFDTLRDASERFWMRSVDDNPDGNVSFDFSIDMGCDYL